VPGRPCEYAGVAAGARQNAKLVVDDIGLNGELLHRQATHERLRPGRRLDARDVFALAVNTHNFEVSTLHQPASGCTRCRLEVDVFGVFEPELFSEASRQTHVRRAGIDEHLVQLDATHGALGNGPVLHAYEVGGVGNAQVRVDVSHDA
jgi:hypothetical protein